MLQSKLRQAITRMEADSAQRLCGSASRDIDFDEGVVGTDILSAFLTFVYGKHRRIFSRRFTFFFRLAARRFISAERSSGLSLSSS
jgi:hypothetical protein